MVGESLIQGTLAPQLCRLCATAIVTNKTLFLTYSSSMAFRNNLVLAGDTVMTLGSNSLSSLAVPSYWSDFVGKFTNHVMVYGGRVIETGALGPLPWMGGISVAGELVCGGVLTVTTNVGFIPAYGDTFQLFDARRLSGAFASLRLPALRDGLAWDTRRLMVDGTLQVTLAPPRIAAVTSPGGSLSIRFPTDGGVRYVLESTPSLQPPAPWTPQTTNLGTGEAMTFALPETRAAPQLYFRVGALP